MLLKKITSTHKALLTKTDVVAKIIDRKIEVLLTLGAGDIDQLIEPLKKKLESTLN